MRDLEDAIINIEGDLLRGIFHAFDATKGSVAGAVDSQVRRRVTRTDLGGLRVHSSGSGIQNTPRPATPPGSVASSVVDGSVFYEKQKKVSSPISIFCRAAQRTGDLEMRNCNFHDAMQAYSTALTAGDSMLSDSRKSALYASRSNAFLGLGDCKAAQKDAALSLELQPASERARASQQRASEAARRNRPSSLKLENGATLQLDLSGLRLPKVQAQLPSDAALMIKLEQEEAQKSARRLHKSRWRKCAHVRCSHACVCVRANA